MVIWVEILKIMIKFEEKNERHENFDEAHFCHKQSKIIVPEHHVRFVAVWEFALRGFCKISYFFCC